MCGYLPKRASNATIFDFCLSSASCSIPSAPTSFPSPLPHYPQYPSEIGKWGKWLSSASTNPLSLRPVLHPRILMQHIITTLESTKSSKTWGVTPLPIAPPDRSEMTFSTGRQQSWGLMSHPMRVVSISSQFISQQTTLSNRLRFPSQHESIIAILTPTAEFALTFSKTSGPRPSPSAKSCYQFALCSLTPTQMTPLFQRLRSYCDKIGPSTMLMLASGPRSLPCKNWDLGRQKRNGFGMDCGGGGREWVVW